MAYLQHSKEFDRVPLIGPCLHTIHNQDLMVPLEGFEDGLTGPPSSLMQRDRLGRRLFLTAMLDKKVFLQRQIEECRELLRHAVNAEDRAFWQHVAERWEGLLKQIKETAPRKKSEVPIISSALLRSNKSPAIT